MGIYGHRFDEYKESNIFEVTDEEAYVMIDKINESLLEWYEDMEDCEELVTEGANIEMQKIFRQYKKDIKDLQKKYRKDYKNDKEAAIKDLDEINKKVTETIKAVKAIDADNLSSTILAYVATIAEFVIKFYLGLKISVGAAKVVGAVSKNAIATELTARAGGMATGWTAGTKLGNQIAGIIENLDKIKKGKETKAAGLNPIRAGIIQTLENTRTWNNALKAGIRQEIKNQKAKDEE